MLYTHHSQFTRLGPNCTAAPALGSRFFCATCWREFSPDRSAPDGSGYGIDRAGGMHCYSCCHVRDVAELFDRTKPFAAYLSGNGRSVGNWPGDILGAVVHSSTSRTGWHGSTLTHVRVRDVHGAYWHGKGAGPGMCITLRPCKA